MQPPAAVFDLDGTLIDSIADVVGAANRLLAEEGRPAITVDAGRLMIGEGAGKLVERAFAATGAAPDAAALGTLTKRYVAIYERHPIVETTLFPGVVPALERLAAAGYALGVCTNKPHDMTMALLDALDLSPWFGAVIGGDALAVRKPDAAHLAAVIERLGAAPARTVYVGDSPTDAATARNADVPFVAVSFGYSRIAPERLGADIVVDHFDQVPEAVAALRRS